MSEIASHELVIPPLRFAIVENQLYRGSYPRALNLPFLESLRLKTILSLTAEPLTPEILAFCQNHGINAIHLRVAPTKGAPLQHQDTLSAVQIMIDSSHAPLYVHCLNGSEVTGLAIASLRKLQFWDSPSIFAELMRFSESHSSFEIFLEGLVGEFQIPQDTVEWLWRGLKDQEGLGPLKHRVTLKYLDARLENARCRKLQQQWEGTKEDEIQTNGISVS